MATGGFSNLENAVAKNVDFKQSELRDALMDAPDSPEAYSTFTRAFLKNKIDPTETLVTSALLAIEVSNVYVRYVGLALRFGANANAYVRSPFQFEDGRVEVPIHLAKKIWDLTPQNRDESLQLDFDTYGDTNDNQTEDQVEAKLQDRQRASLDILSMMAIQGLVSDAKITTASLLTSFGINATKFITRHPEFFGSVYGDIKTSGPLGEVFADEIKYFEEWKRSLQNAYGINAERDERIFKYALFLDMVDVLSLVDVYGVLENFRLMFFFQDQDALKVIIPRLKEMGVIGVKHSDYQRDQDGYDYADDLTAAKREKELTFLNWCVSYYRNEVFKIFLDLGVFPDYSFRSKVIRAARAVCRKYPVQCQILNTMTVEMVKRGYGLDKEQLQELSFSPQTVEAVTKEYSIPAWQFMCKIRTGDVNPEVREMAREAGIPVGLNKDQICTNLEGMAKNNPADLKRAIYQLNLGRISLASISLGDIESGKKALAGARTLPGSLSVDEIQTQVANKPTDKTPSGYEKPAPICTNHDSLFRPIEDYPAIDRVTYSDGRSTWCFTSDNFAELLETGINRWAVGPDGEMGEPIPEEIMIEMEQKLSAIKKGALLEKPGSISKGIDEIFMANPTKTERIYEKESDRMLEEFYVFVRDYGIDPQVFSTMTSAEFQELADGILSGFSRITVDRSSPVMALRDFAAATLSEIKNFKNRDQVGRQLASMFS